MQVSLWAIFKAFFRPNIVGYGGGPATIPLLEAEIVDRYGWLTASQFADVLAVGNTLPGPIATKIAAFIGYQLNGWSGALVALLASIGPTVAAMILLYALLFRYRDTPVVAGMLRAVRPVVWVLFVLLVVEYVRFVDSGTSAALAAVAFVLVYFAQLHPAIVMLAALLFGGIALR